MLFVVMNSNNMGNSEQNKDLDPNNSNRNSLLNEIKKYQLAIENIKKKENKRFCAKTSHPPVKKKAIQIQGIYYTRNARGNLVRKESEENKCLQYPKEENSKNIQKFRKDCIIFNQQGKCKRGPQCPYSHMRERIRMCPKVIGGKCENKSCLLSHVIDKHKMPLCTFFQKGQCFNDNCLFVHAIFDRSTPICDVFAKGYFCEKGGDGCDKQHMFLCPEFYDRNFCGRIASGKKCYLSHIFHSLDGISNSNSMEKNNNLQPASSKSLMRYHDFHIDDISSDSEYEEQ
jgi:hypothetical protein